MAGIYVHIPFCASRCIYCGFYSTTRRELRQRYVDAVCKEWQMRSQYINNERVHTIYIGGGTPSQLTDRQLEQLFDAIGTAEEVTLECNPDDLTAEYAAVLSQLPVNRVSMGVQTFSDDRLRFLHRRHTAGQISTAVERLRQAGIGNISVDLMFGFPGETLSDWQHDIRSALQLGVEHLSAYSLMYEEGTPLYKLLESGKIEPCDEETERQMYGELIDRLTSAGYEHYEISNFARPGYRSRHNSSYWHGVPYIGLGAAAHSFDGQSRQWNIDDVERYIEGVERGEMLIDREEQDDTIRYNEQVMTSLRTCEGLLLDALTPPQRSYCLAQSRRYLDDGLLLLRDGRIRLTRKGLFVSNMVMSGLMEIES
jgi:oxygen-independent coproporphyrinogen-3 oxidase